MQEIWTPEEEAEQLRGRFVGINKKDFAQKYKVPGGASMLSQHLSGHRPMSLAAATAYARGFGVPLGEISPRLAREVAEATGNTAAGAPAAINSIPRAQWPFDIAQERLQVLEPRDWDMLNNTIRTVVEVREGDLRSRKSARAQA